MILCMRTTVDLKDALLKRARKRAAEQGRTLTSLIDEGLRLVLTEPVIGKRQRILLPVSKAVGGIQAGVDLDSNANLEDHMQ